ncbi:hypothetical protein [Chryseobacterium sp. M5A1_1a]
MKILFILLFAAGMFSAQKLTATDFKFAHFYLNKNNEILLTSFSSIDKNGNLNVYLEGYKETPYYSSPLEKNEINELNKLFSKPLDHYIIKEKVPKSTPLSERYYISYKIGGKEERLCFMEKYVTGDFVNAISILLDKIYMNVQKDTSKKVVIDTKNIKNEIIAQIKKDKTLPVLSFDSPPPPISSGPR